MPYSITFNAPVSFLSPVVFQRSVPVDTNTVMYQANLAVISRLSAAAINYTPEQYKPIFSQQIHSTPASYTRNLSCWAYDLSQQLTCCSPWNLAGIFTRAGTLITPRHIIYAAHYQLTVGQPLRFITVDNQIVTRTLVRAKAHPDYDNFYPDLAVGLLDSDVPETISHCYLLPENYQEYFSSSPNKEPYFFVNPRCGVLYTDQEEKVLVGDLKSFGNNLSFRDSAAMAKPTNALKLSAYEDVEFGDSGSPLFLILDNKLVLLTVWALIGAGDEIGASGTNFANQLSAINQLIQDVDTLQGISTGYTVTTISLSSYTSLSAI